MEGKLEEIKGYTDDTPNPRVKGKARVALGERSIPCFNLSSIALIVPPSIAVLATSDFLFQKPLLRFLHAPS
jgi:hypothetical protein